MAPDRPDAAPAPTVRGEASKGRLTGFRSSACGWAAGLAVIAVLALTLHVAGIPHTPQRPTFWLLALADLTVLGLAIRDIVRRPVRVRIADGNLIAPGRWRPRRIPLDRVTAVAVRDVTLARPAGFFIVLLLEGGILLLIGWAGAPGSIAVLAALILGAAGLAARSRAVTESQRLRARQALIGIRDEPAPIPLGPFSLRGRRRLLERLHEARPDLPIPAAPWQPATARPAAFLLAAAAAAWVFFGSAAVVAVAQPYNGSEVNSAQSSVQALQDFRQALPVLHLPASTRIDITRDDCDAAHDLLLGPPSDAHTVTLVVNDSAASARDVKQMGDQMAAAAGADADEFGGFDQDLTSADTADLNAQVTGPGFYFDLTVYCVPDNDALTAELHRIAHTLTERP